MLFSARLIPAGLGKERHRPRRARGGTGVGLGRILLLFACSLPVALRGAAAERYFGSDLALANGDCESQGIPPNNFTVTPVGSINYWQCSARSRNGGSYAFYCGDSVPHNQWVSIDQTVAVPAGAVAVRLEGFFRNGNAEQSRVHLAALTSSDDFVTSASTALSTMSWTAFQLDLGPFSPGVVAKARLQLEGTLSSGSYCDAYFDDLRLRPVLLTTTGVATTAVATTAPTTSQATSAETTGEISTTGNLRAAMTANVSNGHSTAAFMTATTRASTTAISKATAPTTATTGLSAATILLPTPASTAALTALTGLFASTAITPASSSSDGSTPTASVTVPTSNAGIVDPAPSSDPEFPFWMVFVVVIVAMLLMCCFGVACVMVRKRARADTSIEQELSMGAAQLPVSNGFDGTDSENEQHVIVYSDFGGLMHESSDDEPAIVYASLDAFREH